MTKQQTICAVCGKLKSTPLRRDEMGGYVCLACVDKFLDVLQNQYKEMVKVIKKAEPQWRLLNCMQAEVQSNSG